MSIIPVILCGGSGTRLWPLSRQLVPKQFLSVAGDNTLLQDTVIRLAGLDLAAPMLVCHEEHRFSVAGQLSILDLDHQGIILEPVGRNTAPAAAIAALEALTLAEDPVLLVLPADHVVSDPVALGQAVSKAAEGVKKGHLALFGVTPSAPETGYGYIRRGAELLTDLYRVDEFVEKPDHDTACQYLADGDYLWNSGMFMFSAKDYLEALQAYSKSIYDSCHEAYQTLVREQEFARLSEEAFSRCPSNSIDYAVMEHTAAAVVVSLNAGWNDVGSWSSLWAIGDKDEHGNVLRGDVLIEDTRNTYVHAEHRLVSTLGVDDLVIVDTPDALLVSARENVERVKQVVARLKEKDRPQYVTHRKVFRPWGSYDSLENGPGFQVKRLTVSPGARLSLQKHRHRSEHWVVVSGTARVTCGDQEFPLQPKESTFIPAGTVHRLENPGSEMLEVIEVQTGSYFGEDDIERFDDDFNRS
ncbi:MAG: mannose-1-phosphate guanylyltransferase/mannose-6-phosphate isomerase [Pseudomonadota bacterium]|nr:mannose-1-phosphate guanylyltransferase/mannose-6-phosphate isomerase [Pseudomonadota bacterium]